MITQQHSRTQFGALNDYVKGDLEIINDDPKHYAFSNVFEVASRSMPYEKVVVALNLGYVLEAVRAEGVSPWYTAAHDEFAIVMDGAIDVDLVKLASPGSIVEPDKQGTVLLEGEPAGVKMGWIKATRGHQVLLPSGAAYRFSAATPGVLLIQTVLGDLSVQKWSQICYT